MIDKKKKNNMLIHHNLYKNEYNIKLKTMIKNINRQFFQGRLKPLMHNFF